VAHLPKRIYPKKKGNPVWGGFSRGLINFNWGFPGYGTQTTVGLGSLLAKWLNSFGWLGGHYFSHFINWTLGGTYFLTKTFYLKTGV